MDYLKEILRNKKNEIKSLYGKFEDRGNISKKRIDKNFIDSNFNFIKNIIISRVNIIAEIKKASPSRGIINGSLDIEKTAILYSKYKSFISAISVITEPVYFKGSIDFLEVVKKVSDLPVLRKDFIFNESQIYESAALGADCILLISSLLGQKKLNKLYGMAKNLGLDVLVEAHDVREFDKAFNTGARLIGINNRNLKNMKINSNNAVDILENVSGKDIEDKIIVCESGIGNTGYIKDLYKKGIKVFLIGSYFMQSKNLAHDLSDMEDKLRRENLI
ncbi:MAG: indole-3-glycerol phosphate synthase TrpC [Actinobacteria bacterium]|nr:indole-3-glycerol phosphate synthase TrpC [Actinomycetota bacterium]